MVESAAHLSKHVFPRFPVRQCVLSVPQRRRYFMQCEGTALNMVLRILLRVIAQTLEAYSLGSSLNEHVHFHACAVDGVFEEVAGEGDANDQARAQVRSRGVIFHLATGLDADEVGQAQASLRRRILRALIGRSLLESFEVKEMLGYKHSGLSVNTSVA